MTFFVAINTTKQTDNLFDLAATANQEGSGGKQSRPDKNHTESLFVFGTKIYFSIHVEIKLNVIGHILAT